MRPRRAFTHGGAFSLRKFLKKLFKMLDICDVTYYYIIII